jgi:hypothetical protein
VEQENAEIKRRLALITGEIQSLISPAQTYASPAHSHPHAAPAPGPLSAHTTSTPGSVASPASVEGSQSHGWHGGDIELQAKAQLSQQRHEMRHGLDLGPERLGLGFLLDPKQNQRINKIQSGLNGAQDTPRFHHIPMKHDWTNVRNDQALKSRVPGSVTGVPGAATTHTPPPTATTPPDTWQMQRGSPAMNPQHRHAQPSTRVATMSPQQQPTDTNGTAYWAIPVKNCPPTCPLDSLLLDFLYERKQRVLSGISAQEVVGPRYPSVSSLLNPANSAYSHPLSKVFTDILSTFPDISTLPEKAAVLYIMFLVMRWQISPTQENYERLPEWMRPCQAQMRNPHPAWVDHIPFVRMRERIAQNYSIEQYPFDNFFIPFTTTLRVNWPYEETDILLESPDGEELMINPVFERHLRNADNWSLGEPILKAFPSLQGTCKIDPTITARGSVAAKKTK